MANEDLNMKTVQLKGVTQSEFIPPGIPRSKLAVTIALQIGRLGCLDSA